MCGICGLWYPFKAKNEEIISDLTSISDKLIHRGPDDFGTWTSKGIQSDYLIEDYQY